MPSHQVEPSRSSTLRTEANVTYMHNVYLLAPKNAVTSSYGFLLSVFREERRIIWSVAAKQRPKRCWVWSYGESSSLLSYLSRWLPIGKLQFRGSLELFGCLLSQPGMRKKENKSSESGNFWLAGITCRSSRTLFLLPTYIIIIDFPVFSPIYADVYIPIYLIQPFYSAGRLQLCVSAVRLQYAQFMTGR
jgi:hypothetical protein